MPINYPSSIDLLRTDRRNGLPPVGEVVDANDINDIARYINAVATELGINPSGASVTVAARLASASHGTSTQTPGAVTTVNIAHGLAAAPTGYTVSPANVNSRGAPAFYLSVDATNLILNFAANLTAATSYSWSWQAQA